MSEKTRVENGRISFAETQQVMDYPDLLSIQLQSFRNFIQDDVPPDEREDKGLQAVFKEHFPIEDSRGRLVLEFIEYLLDPPRHTVEECLEQGLTYSVTLKAKLRLSGQEDEDDDDAIETIEDTVYLGTIPYMTDRGTFVINGAERVIVSQLHRSPGVFFNISKHPNGAELYSARVIPMRGSWIEFSTDVNNVMWAYIDLKKKLPVTTLLRALGYSDDETLIRILDLADEVPVKNKREFKKKAVGRKLAVAVTVPHIHEIVDEDTGEILDEYLEYEVLLPAGHEITEEDYDLLKEAGVDKIFVAREIDEDNEDELDKTVLLNTLQKDPTHNEEEALKYIYQQLRGMEAPDKDAARGLLERMFFSEKRYDLGEVGRYRMNKRLGLDIPLEQRTLTHDDILAIVREIIKLQQGKSTVDDIDHLGNRRVRTVGEQLQDEFSLALARMARTIKERMNLRDIENLKPSELINSRTLTSVINSFFGTNQLSQFMDQTNPLSELTHKRRTSALGPGGLTRERAGFEVRDVHYTHYGRLCPIETPEGPNIGLISSLCVYAQINEYGFIETPYRVVKNGKVTNEIKYLTAEEEDNAIIAQANAPIDENGHFLNPRVRCRFRGDFPEVEPEKVQYMDVSPNQIISPSASLIPFLEHDDANRALMGSNMQRQAVPLLQPEAPIVGTGLEKRVAHDSRALLLAEGDGVVEYVDARKIVIRYDQTEEEALTSFDEPVKTYPLIKFRRTNQDTAINHKPRVKAGDRVTKGTVLADGFSTENGELALGKNVLVAFMPWRGYNFEDAIVISERLVSEDVYTSVHIEEFELEVRDTKRGQEELTREIPNVSEEATKDLDERGIIRVGAEIKAGDIIVGKITPKGETEPTPEEKLLRAIFGEKAGDVKDASLKAPPGMKGVVIDTKLFSRKSSDSESKRRDKKEIEQIEKETKQKLAQIYTQFQEKLSRLLKDAISEGIVSKTGEVLAPKGAKFTEQLIERLTDAITHLQIDTHQRFTSDDKINELVQKLIRNYLQKRRALEAERKRLEDRVKIGDDLPAGIQQLAKVYVAKKRKIQVGDKMAGRHGNKGVVAKIVPVEDMPFLEDGTPVDIVLNPLGVPSRMNLGQIFETLLGWAGKKLGVKFASPPFEGASEEEIGDYLEKAGLPRDGRVQLYDGMTGEPFDQLTTVGYIYMLKLSHMVEDKIHARSIGPYSLITQQPLGGKAQFGGQRFGEMEVWALYAYGAAHTLREMITIKSDDVQGRSKAYEAIVKGENLPEPNIPESFNVLVRELQGLGLEVNFD